MSSALNGKFLGFLGGGNMAEAILRGVLARGIVPLEKMIVSDKAVARLELLGKNPGVETTVDNGRVLARAGFVLVAVKPQNAAELLAEIAPMARPEQAFVSICAGLPARFFEERLATDANPRPRIVRVMPNTPALIGEGMAGLCAGAHATEEDLAAAEELFRSVGRVLTFPEEKMDAVTAVSGSGPAYLFAFVEALAAGAEQAGFTPDEAKVLALQTVHGAARLAATSDKSPAELRQAVTSPGGTTAAGLAVLEESGFAEAVAACVKAARRRGEELAGAAASIGQ